MKQQTETNLRSLAMFLVKLERNDAISSLAVMLTLSAVSLAAYALTGDHSFKGVSLVLGGLGCYLFWYKNLKLDYRDECESKASPRYSRYLPVLAVGVVAVYLGVTLFRQLGTDHLLTTFTKLTHLVSASFISKKFDSLFS